MKFPFNKGNIVQSELFEKMYYEVNNCEQSTEEAEFNKIGRATSRPWMNRRVLMFEKGNKAKYEEHIYFKHHTSISFYHKENDEYPYDNPDRLAVVLNYSYSLKPPKQQGKSYDANGCGLSFVTEIEFDNKAFNKERGKKWFIIKSIRRSYDDDAEIYDNFWTMELESVEEFPEPIQSYKYNDGIEQETTRETIVLYLKGKCYKGLGFDRSKINIIKR